MSRRISSAFPPSNLRRTTSAVPSVGCPANGTSCAGVKIRTRYAPSLLSGSMNDVSE
jgi:hypothetical protein